MAVLFKTLNRTCKAYEELREVWGTISDLRDGAHVLKNKAEVYLPRRPDEKLRAYKSRLEKFSYTPVMSNAIREFTARLAASPLHKEGAEGDFWEIFSAQTDGKRRSEPELINLLFSILLYFGRCYVGVDRPRLNAYPRSLLESEGLPNQPYVVILEPLQVRCFEPDEWYLSRQILEVNEPLKEPKTLVRFTLWAKDAIEVYEAEVKLDSSGEPEYVLVGSEWVPCAHETKALVPLASRVPHDLGKPPIAYVELPTELWTGNAVYLKQILHMRIESALTEAGYVTGIVQRVFTPAPPVPLDDPRVIYQPQDPQGFTSDNQHILVGSKFEFSEASGTAIKSLLELLSHIESQIRDLVSLRSSSATAAIRQAAESKEMDQNALEEVMKVYGQKVTALYQDVLELVRGYIGQQEPIKVSGLDSYSQDSLEEAINFTDAIIGNIDFLSPVAVKLWFQKLQKLMHPSLSPEVEKEIDETTPEPSQVLDAQNVERMLSELEAAIGATNIA